MLSTNQIKRIILHTKRALKVIPISEEPYYRGLIDGLELVLSMNEHDVNNKPLNKEQNHELSLPIRHGSNRQGRA